jgi:hypothetical protein
MEQSTGLTMELNYVRCRTIGHAWYEIDADKPSPIGWYLWLKCERCDSIRMDTVDVFGKLTARSYRHPDGYRDAAKMTRSQYRVVLHDRLKTLRDRLRSVSA